MAMGGKVLVQSLGTIVYEGTVVRGCVDNFGGIDYCVMS
jgi:hypothetical protein